jgi:hypothetical protein
VHSGNGSRRCCGSPWKKCQLAGFTLVLANGRRIESSWSFTEADLQRLIRAAEA